jgi:tetratricopeptide (TPR) repeat protein
MHRIRIPTAPEIRRLVLFLLGRQPSERALVELSQRPLGTSADLILLGAEFGTAARRGVLAVQPMPHHRHDFAPTRPELRWLSDLLLLSPDAPDLLARARDWSGLLALVLRDPALAPRMQQEWRDHPGLPQLQALMAEVAAAHPTAEAAAALALPRFEPAPPPPVRLAVPAGASREARVAGAEGGSRDRAGGRKAAGPADPPAPAPPRIARITGPALDRAAAEALWQRILADPAEPRLRGELFNAFRQDEKLILYANAKLAEVAPGRCAPYEALVRLLAARLFLRLFMARSAWEAGQAALAADAAAPGALQPGDRNRLHKTLATAALRTGRVEEATELLKALVRRDPLDWEAQMALADVLGGTDPARAAELYAIAMHLNPKLGAAGRLSVAEFLYLKGDRIDARKIILDMMRHGMAVPECHLALGNMALSEGDGPAWAARAKDFFDLQGVSPPAFWAADPATSLFGIAPSGLPRRDDHPMVTVVTTAWNAAETIAGSMRSVLDQTRGNLELLVVDDCSGDGTVGIVEEAMRADPRVRLLRNAANIGTYCSKNRAIREARGAFVTLHDSDDWMHPQRLEMHLEAMMRGDPAASMSNWIRIDLEGRAVLRKGGGGYIHRNPASTFIRRDVFDRVGLFDSVRVGADSEMLWRIRHALGPDSVAEIEACLGLGLHHENSLTQSGVTAFDEFRFSPVRLDYAEAWGRWHIGSLAAGRPLFVDFPVVARAFGAPDQIVVSETPAELARDAVDAA